MMIPELMRRCWQRRYRLIYKTASISTSFTPVRWCKTRVQSFPSAGRIHMRFDAMLARATVINAPTRIQGWATDRMFFSSYLQNRHWVLHLAAAGLIRLKFSELKDTTSSSARLAAASQVTPPIYPCLRSAHVLGW